MNNLTDYLKPDTPDSVREYLAQLEEKSRSDALRQHQHLVEVEARKPATWLIHLDAFRDALFADGEGPDYWADKNYHLANAAWDVRLMIAPDTPQETAQTLAQGLADWVKRMTPEQYQDFQGSPEYGPRIEPPANPVPNEDDLPF